MIAHLTDRPSRVDIWRAALLERVSGGARFAGLYGQAVGNDCRLTALLDTGGRVDHTSIVIEPDSDGRLTYPSLTPDIPSAVWYERAAHDLSGVVPLGHPRLDPLLLRIKPGGTRPRPGHPEPTTDVRPAETPHGPVDVDGRGLFTIPFGPVRSGVFESIEFLIETPGEDIPHLNIRPHYKHRGIAKSFEGRTAADGVLVAERVEGIASVAHALAFSHAIETIAGADVPRRPQLIRVIYAELERIANHLDAATRLADAGGLTVATSRFGWHKETVLRLVSHMSGSRFGRGVVIPGGVRSMPALPATEIRRVLHELSVRLGSDVIRAMRTPSFLDRLRGTGTLDPKYASRWGLVGPIGRASGSPDDARWTRPTDAYRELALPPHPAHEEDGDALARLRVRWSEVRNSISIIRSALDDLERTSTESLNTPVSLDQNDGFGIGWAEAPQGEVVHAVSIEDGTVVRCFARSASLHNLVSFHDAFHNDIFTDFPFIEASFGLSYAGVAM